MGQLANELCEEAEFMERTIDEMCAKTVDPQTRKRVERMRQGATLEQSKNPKWYLELFDVEEGA